MSTDEASDLSEDEIRAIVQDELEGRESLTSGTVPVSRRGLLKGGAAVGIGALGGSVLGNSGSGRVSAQTAAGQVGTDSNRVDVLANLVDATSVSTAEVNDVIYVSDIQNLQTEIDNAPSGSLIILEGPQSVSDSILPITLREDLSYQGYGIGDDGTVIDASGVTSRIFEADQSGEANDSDYIHLRDIAVVGDKTGGTGIYLQNIHRWRLTDCRFEKLQVGVEAVGSYIGTLDGAVCKDNVSHGLHARQGSYRTNALRVFGGGYLENGGNGIRAENLWQLNVNGPDIEYNDAEGIFTDAVSGADISAYFEINGQDMAEGAHVSLSPDTANHGVTAGVNLSGSFFSLDGNQHSTSGTAVRLGYVNGVRIGNCRFASNGGTTYGIELGGRMRNVEIKKNSYDTAITHSVNAPTDGSAIRQTEVNDGTWRTSAFYDGRDAGFALASMSNALGNNVLTNPENSLTVEISAGFTASDDVAIDGDNFPAGTVFRSPAYRNVQLDASTDGAAIVQLTRNHQVLRDISVDGSAATSAGVEISAPKCKVQDVEIVAAGSNGGIVVNSYHGEIRGCMCISGSIDGEDIDINGNNCRVYGNDASVDTADATTTAVAANLDAS